MDTTILRIIDKIYKEKILHTTVADYIETDSNENKQELYEKIKQLLIELNML